ncbi:hypothetical protein D7Z26_13215 [Cohnella endophytica]|uniref:FecR protein domain-containing protein n=1 Tax=Cohnella endophytica TaxID=2419778 RepID=A0A494Y1K8_9BACL|nr:FecR domain-containing protein [Cohnella endophytica]RKP54317.1 hypothetical protein D7Z26_13215 [Cohnella endophytica]
MLKKQTLRFLVLILALLPLLGALAQGASAATSRVAVVKELKGSVKVKKAGGSKEFTAFAKMSLNEGDILIVGEGGSAVLQFANGTSEDDQMGVSSNTTLTFSKLSDRNGTTTKVSMLKGSVWSSVKSIKNKDDQFTLETPTAIMGVRGTNLFVGVDPLTGESKFFIASGVGQVTPKAANGQDPRNSYFIYPSQQLSLDDSQSGDLQGNIIPVDLDSLIRNVSPKIIEEIIKSKAAIDKENEDFINKQKQLLENGGQAETNTTLDIKTLSDLERISRNLDNLISNLVKKAIDNNIVNKDAIKKIVDEANLNLAKKINLDNVQPLELTDKEKAKQAEILKKLKEKEDQLKKQKELEDAKRKQEELLKKLEEQKKKTQDANKAAEELKKKKAKEEYEKQLAEVERKKFEEENKKREEELKQQQQTASPSPGTGSGGGGIVTPPVTLPDGITGLSITNGSQSLSLKRSNSFYKQYSVNAGANASSINVQFSFGSDVTKVELMTLNSEETMPTVTTWSTSGEIKSISIPNEGYNVFSIKVSKANPLQSEFENCSILYVLRGVSEPVWPNANAAFTLYPEGEDEQSISLDQNFAAVVPAEIGTIYLVPGFTENETSILPSRILVNGVELNNMYGFFIELNFGVNQVIYETEDMSGYYTHAYSFTITRAAKPTGVLSWTINGQENSIQPVSGYYGSHDARFSASIANTETNLTTLKIELVEGIRNAYLQVNYEQENVDLEGGINSISLPVENNAYNKFVLVIGESSFELMIKVGEPEYAFLYAGGIEASIYRDYAEYYQAIYAEDSSFFVGLPTGTEDVEFNLHNFLGNLDATTNDIRFIWHNAEIKRPWYSEGSNYYYIQGLENGVNSVTIIYDPFHNGTGKTFRLWIYVGEIPNSLALSSISGTLGESSVLHEVSDYRNVEDFTFTGTLQQSGQVTLNLVLNDSSSNLDLSLYDENDDSLTVVKTSQGHYQVKWKVTSFVWAQIFSFVVVDNQGRRIKYEVVFPGNPA